MIITKKHVSRRTVLRGLGATLALPLLDAMSPALTALQHSPARPARRFSVIYLPNGVRMDCWTPFGDGVDFDLPQVLEPLASLRRRLTIVSGLMNGLPHAVVHGAASTRFLTTVAPTVSSGLIVEAGMSMDQLAANEIGGDTAFSSLELTLESGFAGLCDLATSCAYTDTIAWRGPNTPLPMEHQPRAVFERLFGDSDATDVATRKARVLERRSILDSILDATAELARGLGDADRARLGEYIDAVRDVERRIERTERPDQDALSVARPTGIPRTFPEHARLMFDLQVLALQSDLTRVVTCMTGRELSGRTYPEIGITDAHHPISHHQNDADKLEKLAAINAHHLTQVAYVLDRLRSTPDGDGTLLDHTTVLCGAGMSDSNAHSPYDLPILLAGGDVGTGRHVRVPEDTPIANLHVTLLAKLGLRVDHFGNSTGPLADV
jgi:hypothetical protein